MTPYRQDEMIKAINAYTAETQRIYESRIELARQELEAWHQLQAIIYADNPEKISSYFCNHLRNAE